MTSLLTINIKSSEKKIIDLKIYDDGTVKKINIVVHDNAAVEIYDTTNILDITFSLFKNSKLIYVFVITDSLKKSFTCRCEKPGAHAIINGIFLLNKNQKVFLTTRQEHNSADTKSSFVSKAILGDQSYFEHEGTIFIGKNSSGTNAQQMSKAIVLSEDACVNSSPALEVLNKNVQCSHGSAVGHVDDQQLFYMCCKGVPEKKAKQMLLQAFLLLPCNLLSDEKIKQDLSECIKKRMRELL